MPTLRSGKSAENLHEKMPATTSPVAPPRNKHASNGTPTNRNNEEIVQLRECLSELQLSIDSLRVDFQSKLDGLTYKCDTKASVDFLKTQLDLETGIIIARIESVEQRITQIEAQLAAKAEFDTETTVIARGLPTQATCGPELLTEAKKLVQDVLGLDNVNIARAKRLPSRNGQLGLVKVQLQSLEEKKAVLRAKHKVKEKEGYRNVYIRGSKTHVERLVELNFRTLLDDIPNGHNKYTMTANGRLVKRNTDDDQPYVQAESRRGRGGGRGRGQIRGRVWVRGQGRDNQPQNEDTQQQDDEFIP